MTTDPYDQIREAETVAGRITLGALLDAAETGSFERGRDSRDQEIADVRETVRILSGELDEAATQIGTLKQQLEDCQHPGPVVRLTEFGACPIDGGEKPSAALSVVNKWGPRVTVRIFDGGGTITPITDSNVGRVHLSYKPDIAAFLRGDVATVGAASAAAQQMRPGDVLEAWHEYDVKANKGAAPCSWTDWIPFKQKFADVVRNAHPDVLVGTTVSIARLMTTKGKPTGEDMSMWADVAGDVLGIDFDGGRPPTDPTAPNNYPIWNGAPALARALADRIGYRDVACPEFIHERLSWDGDGTNRAAWADQLADEFQAANFLYVHLFEYNRTGGRPLNPFTTPAELDVWQRRVTP